VEGKFIEGVRSSSRGGCVCKKCIFTQLSEVSILVLFIFAHKESEVDSFLV